MRRMYCLLIVFVSVFAGCTDAVVGVSELQESNAKLIVCGEDITEDHHVRIDYETESMEIPLVAVTEALGAQVTWKTSKIADIIFEDATYRLNLNKLELRDLNSDKGNILRISPGAQNEGFIIAVEKDVIIDEIMINYFLYLRKMRCDIDFENSVIKIAPNSNL